MLVRSALRRRPLLAVGAVGFVVGTSAACAGSGSTPVAGTPATVAVERPAAVSPEPSATAATPAPRSDVGADEQPVPGQVPGTLPSGPATPPPPPAVPSPGSLATADWPAQAARVCAGGRPGDVVLGDLDGDGREEAAVPVTCEGPARGRTRVLVFAGDAAGPRLLGDALPPEERAELQAVQVRERYLVVGAVAASGSDPDGPADTAVTTRWVVDGSGGLLRTDRWTDPAGVLKVDETE